jgi:hypothetical protein
MPTIKFMTKTREVAVAVGIGFEYVNDPYFTVEKIEKSDDINYPFCVVVEDRDAGEDDVRYIDTGDQPAEDLAQTGDLCCPVCGEPAETILEHTMVEAHINVDGERWNYAGGSNVCWDSQKKVRDPQGRCTLKCCNGHEWLSDLPEESEDS